MFNGRGIVGFEVGKRFGLRFCGQAFESTFGRAVQNGYARAVRRSVAMMLQRECGRAGVRSRDTEWIRSNAMKWMRRRCSGPSRVSCASARKLFFFQRKEGVRSGKGARACGKSCHFDTPEKKRDIDFGACVGYYVE